MFRDLKYFSIFWNFHSLKITEKKEELEENSFSCNEVNHPSTSNCRPAQERDAGKINSLNAKVAIIQKYICSANQLTGSYMMATLVFNELRN